jgi:hypothetical protein
MGGALDAVRSVRRSWKETWRPRVVGGGPRRGALAWWSEAFDAMSSLRHSGLGRTGLVGGALGRWAGPWTRRPRCVRHSVLQGGDLALQLPGDLALVVPGDLDFVLPGSGATTRWGGVKFAVGRETVVGVRSW